MITRNPDTGRKIIITAVCGVGCPTCGAIAGTRCMSAAGIRSGSPDYAHAARREAFRPTTDADRALVAAFRSFR